jgi:P27 family predicted phage terminase small subunit
MGKRGPAPKPTALRLLHGDRPARTNQDEPRPGVGPPECPDGVTSEVREVWDYTLNQLMIMGIATPADRDALLCYCEAVVSHRRASAILAKSPVLVPGVARGTVVRNPALQIQRDAALTVRVFAGQFGLTPSARSEIRKDGAGSHGPSASRYLTGT